MSKTILSQADAAALARVIEEGIDYLAAGSQRETAVLVAHRLLTSQGATIIETSVPQIEEGNQ